MFIFRNGVEGVKRKAALTSFVVTAQLASDSSSALRPLLSASASDSAKSTTTRQKSPIGTYARSPIVLTPRSSPSPPPSNVALTSWLVSSVPNSAKSWGGRPGAVEGGCHVCHLSLLWYAICNAGGQAIVEMPPVPPQRERQEVRTVFNHVWRRGGGRFRAFRAFRSVLLSLLPLGLG